VGTLRQAARLGYNPTNAHQPLADWGLVPDDKRKELYLPRGITIPWMVGDECWRLNIRRSPNDVEQGGPKYLGPAGSSAGLYNADSLHSGRPVLLAEGEFDALIAQQRAGDMVAAVSTGSTQGARRVRWIGQLAAAPLVLVAFDADGPGDEAAQYWLDILPNAKRWRPYWADINAMAQAGMDVRAWVLAGLAQSGG
jgi:hypothetical protein